jgi:hypothetical protein
MDGSWFHQALERVNATQADLARRLRGNQDMSSPEPASAAMLLPIRKMASYAISGAAAARNVLRQRAYPAFCEALACVGRPSLLSRAKEVTSKPATRSCVVPGPHPDDETLGCGATIMRKIVTGTPVEVVIATDGRHSQQSTKLSADALGRNQRGRGSPGRRHSGASP